MNPEISVIVEEVKQLVAQYLKEVPSGRNAWPQAIYGRIKNLWHMGLTPKEISNLTSVPYCTIYQWSRKDATYEAVRRKAKFGVSGSFVPIQVQAAKKTDSTVTVISPQPQIAPLKERSLTVTVKLPNGMSIEGVTPEFLSAWLGKGISEVCT